jgi:inosine/xanthosine triphosphate pyrophosphatase family protein
MTPEEKNRISHRARALEKMKKILKIYFEKGEFID